jgi:cytochrome c553
MERFSSRSGRWARRAAWLVLATSAFAFAHAQAGPAEPPIDSIAERTRACTACHGKEGRATPEGYFPRIAGKPAGYLFNQLQSFREGRRTNAAMTYLVQHLSDDYLREIAQHFAALELPYASPPALAATPAQFARGETLVKRGDSTRRVPACVQCHGETLTGVTPAVPGLLGLSHDYLTGQFGAWRTGHRRALAPDCMAQIAERLADDDVTAIAAWLSTRTLPFNPKPAASIVLPLPMACGSVPGGRP